MLKWLVARCAKNVRHFMLAKTTPLDCIVSGTFQAVAVTGITIMLGSLVLLLVWIPFLAFSTTWTTEGLDKAVGGFAMNVAGVGVIGIMCTMSTGIVAWLLQLPGRMRKTVTRLESERKLEHDTLLADQQAAFEKLDAEQAGVQSLLDNEPT